MKKSKKSNEIWWKMLILFTFVISLSCLYILVIEKEILPKYKYITKIIELDNDNEFNYVNGKVIDYVCDEGVIFRNNKNSYYASTWEGDSRADTIKPKYKGMKGRCMIKIRMEI